MHITMVHRGTRTEKREKRENSLWGVRPSGQAFSTWPHRKLANEIRPRKAIIYI